MLYKKKAILYDRLEEIEMILRYCNIDTTEINSIVKSFIEALGRISEANSLINKLMEDVKNEKI